MTLRREPMIHATLCFLLRDDPEPSLLLGVKKRGFGKGKLNGIGGKLSPHETPEEGICREVFEEIRVRLEPASVQAVANITFRFPFRPEFNHYVHVFVATEWVGTPEETDEIAPLWVPMSDIPYARMWADDAYWLPRVLRGERLDAEFEFGEDNESVTDWAIRTRAD